MDFVIAAWPVEETSARERAMQIKQALPGTWHVVTDVPGFFAACHDRQRGQWQAVSLDDRGVILGQLFDRSATDKGNVAPASPASWAGSDPQYVGGNLMAKVWGAYVAVLRQGTAGGIAVIRDPMGALDCLTWRVAGVRIIASRLIPEIVAAARPSAAIDWDRVAGFVAVPVSVSEALGFKDISAIAPGGLSRIVNDTISEQPLWRPANFCPPHAAARPPDPDNLSAMVDACVAAWASRYDKAVAELSGGLDSSIVASALRTGDHAPVEGWFNYFISDAQGDERRYARAISARLNIPLIEVLREGRALTSNDLAALSTGARPGMTGMDVHYDSDLGGRATSAGAEAIFTGQGGDAVFFQMPTALVAADALYGLRGLVGIGRTIVDVAGWTRSTVWSVARQAVLGRWRAMHSPQPIPSFLAGPYIRASRLHHWLDDTGGLPPAKRMQLWGLANSRVYFGDSERSRICDLVHPLLSQPLVEHVLAIPVIGLTGGDGDRKLARRAYGQRLPETVVWRHGKGDLTAFYGRMIARSAGFLRDHLCGGLLAEHGIVDRNMLAGLLDPDRLAHEDAYTEILTTALVESWVRQWSGF
jgi:asparagine synthase (glutamine-hydrolysing)